MPIVVELFHTHIPHSKLVQCNIHRCTYICVYVDVDVDMNLNVCIMLHRHLRELKAISVLFVTTEFRFVRLLPTTTLDIL